jgi:release factor glutamine methyltransferase
MIAGAELPATEREIIGPAAALRFESLLHELMQGLQTLQDKPEETPETALRALWFLAAGRPMSARAAADRPLCTLTTQQDGELEALVTRRLAGAPLAHLTRRQHFMGIELLAGPEALIPRQETELLGLAAASLLKEAVQMRAQATALDVCTGCGNLAVGLAYAVPNARVLAADLSEDAVRLARMNVKLHGLESRVDVRQGDLMGPFDEPEVLGQVDVLVCNPPYISSGKVLSMPAEIAQFEPQLAFDGGPFGVRILTRLIQEAPRFLRAGGWLAFEVGLGQGDWVMRRLQPSAGYADIRPLSDENGQIRAVLARLAGHAGSGS